MHPMEQKAKMGVMEDLQKMAEHAMGSKLKGGMNKVSVAADSKAGLEHGLEHAHDLLGHLPPAMDDSHPDHENFEGAANHEDGMDGESGFPDADDDHALESNPLQAHHEAEMKEGAGHKFAEGGEVGIDDGDAEEEAEEHGGSIPNYDDMDAGEMSAHLESLVAALKKRGLA